MAQKEKTEAVSFNVHSKLENSKNEEVAMKLLLQLIIFLMTPYRHENMCRRGQTITKFCKKVCRSHFVLRIFCLFVLVVVCFPLEKRTLQGPSGLCSPAS